MQKKLQKDLPNNLKKILSQRGFTLVEILIVIVLVGIIGGIGLRYISSGNYTKQQQFGVECGMYLTEEIENFVDAARKSSGITTKVAGSLQRIAPQKYKISFGANNLQFSYLSGGQTSFTKYRKNQLEEFDCKNSRYTIKLVGIKNIKNKLPISLQMNEGFMGDKPGEISTFKVTKKIGSSEKIIGGKKKYIILQSCKQNYCIDTYKFDLNVAAQKVKSSICRGYVMERGEPTNKCKKRR